MTISKNKATEVATQLLSKKKQVVNDSLEKFSEYVYECWHKSLPVQVRDCFRDYPEHFNSGSTMYLNGNGFNHFGFNTPKGKYAIYKGTACYVQLLPKEAEKAKQLQNDWIDKNKEYSNNVIKIEAALFSLRSFKAIEKHFPEAMKYLPNVVKNEVAINFDELRQIIKP